MNFPRSDDPRVDWHMLAQISMALLLSLMRDNNLWEVRLALSPGAEDSDLHIAGFEANGEQFVSCVAVGDLPSTAGQWRELPIDKVRLLSQGPGAVAREIADDIDQWFRGASR